jgi:ATP/maltotriose-dependent transcriptional regulator MalT
MNRPAAVLPDSAPPRPRAAPELLQRTRQVSTESQPEAEARRLLLQDRPVEAVALALTHGLDDLAAELLALGCGTLARSTGDFDAFFAVVQRLGPERIRRWPALEAAAIWAFSQTNQLRLATIRLDELEARIPQLTAEGRTFITENLRTPFDRTDPATGMQSWVGMMRILIASLAGESAAALRMSQSWLQDFPRATEYDRATVRCASGHAYFMNDRYPEAERDGLASLMAFREARTEFGMAQSTTCAGSAQILQGRVQQAGALLEDISRRISGALQQPTHAEVPLSVLRAFAKFECGDAEAALVQAQHNLQRSARLPFPLLLYCSLCVVARSLLALNRPEEALALFDRVDFQGSADAQAWWDGKFAVERALTAAVAGETARRAYAGPAAVRNLLELLAASRRCPDPALLRPLRARLQQAVERHDSEAVATTLFLKARIAHDVGQPLQARRSVQQLLTGELTRERIGSLAALAGGLQPMFCEVLRSLLLNPTSATAELRRLAQLLGKMPADEPAAKAQASADAPAALSKRERQIAAALLDSLSNREIAERLHLTEQTVKWHLWNLFRKLGVRNRSGAVRTLMKQGFTA